MGKGHFVGFKFNNKWKVNMNKSTNPLAKLSYHELQQKAKISKLPAKFQYKVLLALLIAQENGRDDIVDVILKSKRSVKRTTSYNTEEKADKSKSPASTPLILTETVISSNQDYLDLTSSPEMPSNEREIAVSSLQQEIITNSDRSGLGYNTLADGEVFLPNIMDTTIDEENVIFDLNLPLPTAGTTEPEIITLYASDLEGCFDSHTVEGFSGDANVYETLTVPNFDSGIGSFSISDAFLKEFDDNVEGCSSPPETEEVNSESNKH